MMVSGIANIKIFIAINAWKAMKILVDFLYNHPKHKRYYATRNYGRSMIVKGFIDMHSNETSYIYGNVVSPHTKRKIIIECFFIID